MIGMFAAGLALMLGAPPQSSDTTLSVERGAELRVETRAGRVTVDTWKRDAVRVRADRPMREVDVHYGGGDVSVDTEGGGDSGKTEFRITVPEWMSLHLESQAADVTVDGAGGEVIVESTQGDIHVRGGRRFVRLNTVSGAVEVADAQARVRAETVSGPVILRNVIGDVSAETVNGGLSLDNVESDNVKASTVNGSVSFHGPIRPSGYYHLSSHNGPVGVYVTGPPDATISVTAFNSTFDTDFPLKLTGTSDGRHMTFEVGAGSARVELESFNGPIVLGRVGGPRDSR